VVFFAVTKSKENSPCPRCGEPASGRFCGGCGAALTSEPCATCQKPLTPGAKFCHHCGATARSAKAGGGMPPAWAIAASVVVVLVAFIAGQKFASPSSESTD
jgi:predicted amidophosphoribosyltransferase